MFNSQCKVRKRKLSVLVSQFYENSNKFDPEIIVIVLFIQISLFKYKFLLKFCYKIDVNL